MGWCSGFYGLATVNSVCIGSTGFFLYTLVRLARSPQRSTAGIVVLTIFLLFCVSVSACIYPAACHELFAWSALRRCLSPPIHAIRWCLRGVGRLLCLPCRRWRAERARQLMRWSSGGGHHHALPQHSVHGQGHGMSVLPREGPVVAVGSAQVVAAADIPAYAQPDAGASSDCAVCLGEVEKGEMVRRLPACLHIFHQHCIDQWLNGHSTCPVCRCVVFELLLAELV